MTRPGSDRQRLHHGTHQRPCTNKHEISVTKLESYVLRKAYSRYALSMTFLSLAPSVHAVTTLMSSSASEPSSRRAVCGRCARPQSVCLCPALPAQPIRLGGLVVVLQHPNEQNRRLATVPLLQRCLSQDSLLLLRKRKLVHGLWPALDALVEGARQRRWPLFVMYPGPGALADAC